jgi:hypothetical protein
MDTEFDKYINRQFNRLIELLLSEYEHQTTTNIIHQRLETLLDHLAKHITDKPETLKHIFKCSIPSPYIIIQSLVTLSLYSPNERHLKLSEWLNQHVAWLDTEPRKHITTICLSTLTYIEQWLEYSQANQVLTREQISGRIYRLLNCLIAGLGTSALFYKLITHGEGHQFSLEYLFVVAGCYTLLDHLVDDIGSSHSDLTKQAIEILNWYITRLETAPCGHPTMYPDTVLTPLMQEYNRAIYWLITLLTKSISDKDKLCEVIGIMRLCFNVEIRCFKEQTLSSQHRISVIQLGVLKGLSAGYLISTVALNDLYSEYSVLIQLLDDLSDYTEDTQAGIRTFAGCVQSLEEYAVKVGECLAEFIDKYSSAVTKDPEFMLGGQAAMEYVIPSLIMYWLYCMCKTPSLHPLVRQCADRLGLTRIIDPCRILDSRCEKHAAKQNLWKILKEFRA